MLYRHEKTFVNQTLLAINVNDTDDPAIVEDTLGAVKDYTVERVGEIIDIDMVAVSHRGSSVDTFVDLAMKAWCEVGKPLVLRSHDPAALKAAAVAVAGSLSVLATATPDTVDELVEVAKEYEHALALTAPDLDQLVAAVGQSPRGRIHRSHPAVRDPLAGRALPDQLHRPTGQRSRGTTNLWVCRF